MREILRALIEARRGGTPLVVCSLVETRGSTPQKPGAVMVIFPDGRQIGTLGGGCVEAEVRKKALMKMGAGAPEIVAFTLDDDYGWDDGLICGGKMVFALHPVSTPADDAYFQAYHDVVEIGAGAIEVVVVDDTRVEATRATRRLYDGNRKILATTETAVPDADTWGDAVPSLQDRPRPAVRHGLAILPILPRCRLLLVGAGHVGQAVARLAREVDFDVWVLDDREKYACSERFPSAEKIVVDDIGRWLKSYTPDANTYCLIVTRGHSHDEEALFHLAEKPARYVGMIGSRRKIRLILDDLLRQGISPSALARVHAPLGIDIGSQTVPEIAVSIVAQLIGHRNLGADAFPPTDHGLSQTSPTTCTNVVPRAANAVGVNP